MSGDAIYRGLCSTCKHAPSCTFPRDPEKPAFYCEEFEIEIAPARTRAGEDTAQSSASFVGAKESARLIGLCSDCEGRQTCVFPKPEGGVWHCEEYQ
jgi:hypothetical protein